GSRRARGRPSAVRPPDGQRHALRQPFEDDAHAHAESHLVRTAADHVADEARSLVHLDEDEHQRQEMLKGRQKRLVGDDVGVDAPPAARHEPLEPGAAFPVHRLRRPVDAAARPVALEHEPPLAGAVPERAHDGIIDVGQGIVRMHHAARSTAALVATPDAPVTSVALQPGTWLTDFPRICRTPSRPRLKSCTYASASPPPEVSTGSSPPSWLRTPSGYGPPSARRAK